MFLVIFLQELLLLLLFADRNLSDHVGPAVKRYRPVQLYQYVKENTFLARKETFF
jgi:hypothetical protein